MGFPIVAALASFLQILKICPRSNIGSRGVNGISIMPESLSALRRTGSAGQKCLVPFLQFAD
jgi:hypothetical protein